MQLKICLPILLIASLPILLWVLARPPFRVCQPGLRFKLSCLLILTLWCAAKIVFSNHIDLWYWSAGFLFIFACLIFGFMVWSVLCWGYTLCMLLSLQEHMKPVDSREWQKLHAGPQGTRQLTLDRIQVLVKLRLATFEDDQLMVSAMGLYLAIIAKFFMNLFGVK